MTGIWYVVGFLFAGVSFVFLTIGAAWLVSHRNRGDVHKGLPYESGIDTYGDTHGRFGLSFYIYALLFVAFDIEVVFIFLWAIVFRDPAEVPEGFGPSVVAIGKFDGVHSGHRAVIERARVDAAIGNARVVAVTFDRNPLALLRPELCPENLIGVHCTGLLPDDFANETVVIERVGPNELRLRKKKSLAQLIAGITPENLHGEWDTGPGVGQEAL